MPCQKEASSDTGKITHALCKAFQYTQALLHLVTTLRKLQDQLFYKKDCNVGSGPDVCLSSALAGGHGPPASDPTYPEPGVESAPGAHGLDPTQGALDGPSAQTLIPEAGGRARGAERLAYVRSLGEARFTELCGRVAAACEQARVRFSPTLHVVPCAASCCTAPMREHNTKCSVV